MKKYLELFNQGFDSTLAEKVKVENWPFVGYDPIQDSVRYTEIQKPMIGPADNEIWYTSSDKNIVVPNFSNVFGSNLVNNTYNNDTGVITFENTVTNIGDYAFYDCYLMTSIVIPNQVTSIGGCAFSECSSLTSITIPNSVSNIGWMAFSNCSSLNTINFIGSKEQWEKINKNADWKDEDVPEITVHCIDGDIVL